MLAVHLYDARAEKVGKSLEGPLDVAGQYSPTPKPSLKPTAVASVSEPWSDKAGRRRLRRRSILPAAGAEKEKG